MNSMQIISVVVFLVVMIALVTEKVHRTAAAVSGAVLLLCLRILSVDEAVSYIDFGTIGVLIGMMLFVAVVRNSGLFEYMAIKSAKIAKGSPWKIMLLFMILTAVLSAFLDNVTTVLLVGPMAISIAGILGIDPVPFLLTQILASNIGGTATLIGDPPNILIGASCNLSFNDFLINLTPVVLIVMAVTLGVVLLQMRKNLRTAPSAVAQVRLTEPKLAILEPARLSRSMWVFAFVLLGFFTSRLTGLEPGIIAICGAFVMALVCKIELSHMLEKVEWNTILFFSGLFMMVGALEIDGVFNSLGQWMIHMTDGNFALTMMIILWGSAILSAVIDNIPLVISMIPLIQSIVPIFAGQMGIAGSEELITAQIREPLFWALALGACLGGNGTLIGASANVVVCQIARKNRYPVTFWQFTRYGFPLMILSVAICSVYLYFRYIF